MRRCKLRLHVSLWSGTVPPGSGHLRIEDCYGRTRPAAARTHGRWGLVLAGLRPGWWDRAPARAPTALTRSSAQTRICGVVWTGCGVHIYRPPVGGPAGALEEELRIREAQLGGVELFV